MTIPSNHTIDIYYQGVVDGLVRYAHWRDGKQYVGTTGRTLEQAIEFVQREREEFIERNQT